MKILVVEDEEVLRQGLVDLLTGAGHRVEAVADGRVAAERGLDPGFDLIVLDLMLPGLDGVEVCRRIRELRPALPILMLTARGTEDDKVEGLGAGADDYVTKPFGVRELLARIESLERRSRAAVAAVDAGAALHIESHDCRIDLGRCEFSRGDEHLALTAREAAILRCLWANRGRAVPRAELLERVWDIRGDLETRTVDMTIANLRHKIERDPKEPEIVVTVKGIGYAWGEEP